MNKNDLIKIENAVSSALNYIYQDSDAICDDDYYEEAKCVIDELDNAYRIIQSELKRLT